MSRAMTMAGMYDRGDIVVFRYDGGNGPKTLVKRVAGLPGEHIRILPEGQPSAGVPAGTSRADYTENAKIPAEKACIPLSG